MHLDARTQGCPARHTMTAAEPPSLTVRVLPPVRRLLLLLPRRRHHGGAR